jgi:predicted HD phosphohydrolase
VSLHLNDLARWLQQGGAERYGDEPATLLSHLLQSAWRAADAGLPDSLVVACGLHDIGRFIPATHLRIPADHSVGERMHSCVRDPEKLLADRSLTAAACFARVGEHREQV